MIYISLVISVVLIPFTIYHFQVKEYRFDRLLSAIKEMGIGPFLFPERFLVPKKSVRNVTIITIVFAILVTYTFLYFLIFNNINLFSFLLPFVTIATISLAVHLTGKIAHTKRQEVIDDAIKLRNKSDAVFIGVVGSFGKSSVKEFFHKILSQKYKTGKTLGNYNTPIGVAMSINEELKGNTKFFVTEMGAYKLGEIQEIASFIKPTHAIVTGLSNQHLSLFGSKDNLIKTKAELIKATPKEGIIYLNADSKNSAQMVKRFKSKKKIKLYSGERKDVDVYLNKFSSDNGLTIASLVYGEKVFNVRTKLKGRHNFVNLLPVVGLATDLGVSKKDIVKGINSLVNDYGKLSLHRATNKVSYLYDGYSSNVAGFLSALEVFDTFDGDKFVVSKGILELDGDKKGSYQKILDRIAKMKGTLVTSDKLFKEIDTKDSVVVLRGEKSFLDFIKKNCKKTSHVLVEGRFSDKFIKSLEFK